LLGHEKSAHSGAGADYSVRRPAVTISPVARKPTSSSPELTIVECADDAQWERWLEQHHADAPDVWVKIAKKGSGVTTVHYPEVLDTAICFGWIDAMRRPLDDTYFLQRFTARGPRSRWSQVNRDKADGRWDAAYEPQSRASVPDDFQEALDANPAARAFFATLKGQQRYSFLFRLHHVKTRTARERRIASYIELLREGRTLN
jgi:uncharacterized protein YdeI (YjbR/CyaY-like superfamily)